MLKYSFIYLAVWVLMSRVCIGTFRGSLKPKLEFKTVMSFLGLMQGTEQNRTGILCKSSKCSWIALPITSFLVKTPSFIKEMKTCKRYLENSYFDGQYWRMPLIPGLGRQRWVWGQPGLQSELDRETMFQKRRKERKNKKKRSKTNQTTTKTFWVASSFKGLNNSFWS